MQRREFLKTAASAGAAAMLVPENLFAEATNTGATPQLVAIYGGEAVEMFKRGIAEMGGMKRFVSKGQTVVVKPNIGWDRTPDFGANTNPDLVAAVVKECYEAGAKEVLCFDHTCGNDWDNRYKISGIENAVISSGGKLVAGNSEAMYEECQIPKGKNLKNAKVHRLAINPDVFINIPVLKHHSGAKITCAMKNYMGCVWDRKWYHTHDMPQCVADYATFQKTTLTIVDAYRVMLDYGPIGRSPEYAPIAKYQILSTDIVAADAASVQIFAAMAKLHKKGTPFSLSDIKYIAEAEALGVGTSDLSKIAVKRISLAS